MPPPPPPGFASAHSFMLSVSTDPLFEVPADPPKGRKGAESEHVLAFRRGAPKTELTIWYMD